MNHLRYSGKPGHEHRAALADIIRAEPVQLAVPEGLRELDPPDTWLVSGVIYNTVWNRLTGRASVHGIKDIDLIYFDAGDLSYAAEDCEIRRANVQFSGLPLPVELRNQARVHLWFPQRFGVQVQPLPDAQSSLLRYASKTHAIAARLEPDDNLTLFAPFGLDDMFSFRIIPNHVLQNRGAHEEKGARARSNWPEIIVEPW